MRIVIDFLTIILFIGSAAFAGAAIVFACLYARACSMEDYTDGE